MRFMNLVYLARGVLLVASTCLSVFIFEVALRFVWEPMNDLVPLLIADPDTGYRVEPGNDDWGYELMAEAPAEVNLDKPRR